MNQAIQLLDVVALTEDLPQCGLYRGQVGTVVEALAPDDWHRPTECPAWTVKGIALHILGDDFSLLSRQRDNAANSIMLWAERMPGQEIFAILDRFNEDWVDNTRYFSERVVIDLL